jgi:hypothetical protein
VTAREGLGPRRRRPPHRHAGRRASRPPAPATGASLRARLRDLSWRSTALRWSMASSRSRSASCRSWRSARAVRPSRSSPDRRSISAPSPLVKERLEPVDRGLPASSELPDQRVGQGTICLPLGGQGGIELGGRDGFRLDEHVPEQVLPLILAEGGVQLLRRDELLVQENLSQQRAASISCCSASARASCVSLMSPSLTSSPPSSG